MINLLEKIYPFLPNFIHNLFVSTFNIIHYTIRHAGSYRSYKKCFETNSSLTLEELKSIQNNKLKEFVNYAYQNSQFYNELYHGIDIENITDTESISNLPIINKEDIRSNIGKVVTIDKSKAVIRKTGGTTGKSLKVYFSKGNVQERSALLDYFREQSGYKLGKRTAWFSGKNLLTSRDIKQQRFWKTDYWYNVRYYSTFHIKSTNLEYYIKNLIKFKPEYLVGFPSTILDIAKYGISNGVDFPPNIVKAIFPTAETITDDIRSTLEQYFHTRVYDQYATSEGAPFIFECKKGHLHLELQSGIFEVLDNNNNPTNAGRLVVTSFTTYGTPLIRYDIGDGIELSEETCTCGNNNPVVKNISGRINDYIFSREIGKINLGNVSNSLKGVNGILKFQIIQDSLDKLIVRFIKDKDYFTSEDEDVFLKNIRDRVGNKIQIELNSVDELPVEKSGKFRIVKNDIKELIVEYENSQQKA